jgi:SAM-dependent methyltransferase
VVVQHSKFIGVTHLRIMARAIERFLTRTIRSLVGTSDLSGRLQRLELGVAQLQQYQSRGAEPPADAISAPAPQFDHNMMIHQARGALLRTMPPGARRLLSAGCAGTWYFDWVSQCYGDVPEHLGIEYYMPRPDDLPRNVTWIANTASDMSDVATGSCDLVFSGQNIEHLWPAEVVGFLAESARVLQPGGHLVVDSPNRLVTAPMNYSMAEHTVELTVDEIECAVRLAGFDVTKAAGIWLCRDPRTGRVMPWNSNEPDTEWSITERLVVARDHPRDSFIWWLEAKRTKRAPDLPALQALMNEIFAKAWPERIQRLIAYPGRRVERRPDGDWIIAAPGEAGFVMYGPYVPLRPGRYRCRWRIAIEATEGADEAASVAEFDVVGGPDAITLARGEVQSGRSELTLAFTVENLMFAGQFRCVSLGKAGFAVARSVTLEEHLADTATI